MVVNRNALRAMQDRRAAPLQRTLSMANGMVHYGASLTRVLLCRAGDDADLEGGLRRGQELDVIIFPLVTEITQRFNRITGAEVCRALEYVKPGSL